MVASLLCIYVTVTTEKDAFWGMFQIAGMYNGVTPLKLITTYKDCE
jgi:hypothetical protein